jgi:hypothetical protein
VADYLEAAQAGGYTLGAAVEHVNYDKRSGLLDLRDPR